MTINLQYNFNTIQLQHNSTTIQLPLLLEFPLLPDPLLADSFNKERKENNLGLFLDIHYC